MNSKKTTIFTLIFLGIASVFGIIYTAETFADSTASDGERILNIILAAVYIFGFILQIIRLVRKKS